MIGIASALLVFATVVRLAFLAQATLDPDESQHLHTAWLVGEGRVPYADFWEHHTPLGYYLLAPLTWWFRESPAVYFAGRALMGILALLALAAVYRLARRLSTHVALAAVVMLALQPRFLEKTTEIRPDVAALVVWLAALLAVVRWRERQTAAWLAVAGLALGVGVALSLKTVYGALGLGLAIVLAPHRRPREAAGALARLAGGLAVVGVGVVAGLGFVGGVAALRGLGEQVLLGTLTFVDPTKEGPVSEESVGFGLLALAGVGLTLAREGLGVVRSPIHGPLLVPAAVITAALLAPGTPAVYRHAWLPVLAVAAVYAGLALGTLVERARAGSRVAAGLLGLTLVAAVVVPGANSLRSGLRDQNAEQLRLMRSVLATACPGEPVLDGTALAVFRPAAYRYRALINGVRLWVAQGAIPEEVIVADAARSSPRVAVPDGRVRAMVGPLATFLARHYVPAGEGFLVAGATVPVGGGARGGRRYVELLVGGPYRVALTPGVEAAIDRAPVRPGISQLDAGRHEVTWRGPVGAIRLVALGCAERRELEASRRPGS
jgi:Dolichyl-phosphate-mannose-protein mannosyltransferase